MRRDSFLAGGSLLGLGCVLAGCTQILGFDNNFTAAGGGSGIGTTHAQKTSTRSTATSGAGGGGGGGGTPTTSGPPVPCKTPSDCPTHDSDCAKTACTSGYCALAFTPVGTSITVQTTGNCHKIVCDGRGGLTVQVDDTNIPDDNNPCTKDLCDNGTPSNPPTKGGATCGGSLTCDGLGHCTGCTGPADCPGADTECETRSCTGSVCGFVYTAANTSTKDQTPGDCKKNVCSGQGTVSVTFDQTDTPTSTNPCVVGICSAGSPSVANVAASTKCAVNGGTMCDGQGKCVACLTASDCGAATDCTKPTCSGGACVPSYAQSGTATPGQTAGDCHKVVCDGKGGETTVVDTTDAPTSTNTCILSYTCSTSGVAVPTYASQGTACGGTKHCNATGQCVGCVSAADCSGTTNECEAPSCTSSVCGMSYTAKNTAVAAQTAGDCHKNVCDGAGGIVSIVDDTDLPSNTNECTKAACTNGVASNPGLAAGTACLAVTNGVCNGTGTCGVCVPGDSLDCCGTKSSACCNLVPLDEPLSCNPLVESCLTPRMAIQPPIGTCCCGATELCSSAGRWGACL